MTWPSVDRRLEKAGADVYRCFDFEGRLLYVGCSVNAYKRISEHKPYAEWFGQLARFTVDRYASRRVALAIESAAIAEEHPLYNGMPGWRAPQDVVDQAAIATPTDHDDFVLRTVGDYA